MLEIWQLWEDMIAKVVVYTCVGLDIFGFNLSTVKPNYFETHYITSFMYWISGTLYPSLYTLHLLLQ